jgi:putative ABC transport system permease protein
VKALGLWLYHRALSIASHDFRVGFLGEAVDDLSRTLSHEQRTRGVGAACWLWMRAMADAVGAARGDRRRSGLSALAGWGQDLRQAMRGLIRSPQYALTVIGTLALAIGGVTAVFRLADPMLFRRLPFPNADRLCFVSVGGGDMWSRSSDYFRAERAGVFEHMGTFYGPIVGTAASADDNGGLLVGYAVTSGFLDMLGMPIQRGRSFVANEYVAAATDGHFAADSPVLITDGMWASQFARRPDIVGQSFQLRDRRGVVSHTIIGVLAPDFVLPDATNQAPVFLAPGRLDAATEAERRSVTEIYGLRRSDRTTEETTAQLAAIMSGVEHDYPQVARGRTVRLISLQDALFRPVRIPLLMLMGVTVAVLMLAVGNLAHLSLARGTERAREVTVRTALGGTRWRVVRLLLTESLVLIALATVLAVLIGHAVFMSVMAAVPKLAHLYRLMPADLNGRVVGLAVGLGVFALLPVGVLSALWSSSTDLRSGLQQGARGVRGRGRGFGRLLTVLQASLGTSVLVVTILLLASFFRLVTAVHGIDETGLVTAWFEMPADYDGRSDQAHALLREVEARAEHATGQAIGWEGGIPGFTLPGPLRSRLGDSTRASIVATAYPVDRTAMEALRLQLVQGRLFTDEEAHTDAMVAVIDRRTSDVLWPGEENVLGRTVYDDAQVRDQPPVPRQVVGVVETVDVDFGKPTPGQGRAFVPFQTKARLGTLIWRGTARQDVVQALRDALREIEPRARLTVAAFEPFPRRFGEPRLFARVIGVLGVLTLILTIAGIYAVISHATAGRTGEIGVRMALGATAGSLRAMIVREALWPAALGVAVGLGAAFWWAVRLRDLLFQLEPRSPWVFTTAAAIVTGVAILASGIPATRASRMNPVEALRAE